MIRALLGRLRRGRNLPPAPEGRMPVLRLPDADRAAVAVEVARFARAIRDGRDVIGEPEYGYASALLRRAQEREEE